jgi:predicted DNA-binding ribbon-helix-helix protein
MNSTLRKRSIVIGDRRTSVSLEDAFWKALKMIAASRGTTMSELVTEIQEERAPGNLSSRIRLYVLNFYRDRLIELEGGPLASDARPRMRRAGCD